VISEEGGGGEMAVRLGGEAGGGSYSGVVCLYELGFNMASWEYLWNVMFI